MLEIVFNFDCLIALWNLFVGVSCFTLGIVILCMPIALCFGIYKLGDYFLWW